MSGVRAVMLNVVLLIGGLLPPMLSSGWAEEAPPADAADGKVAAGTVSYYRDVRPLFQAHCHGCHQPAKRGGDFAMTDFRQLLEGGESGEAAVVPGQAEASYLVELITPADGQAEMPKGKQPLSESQLKLITRWVSEGAVDDTPKSARPQYDMQHPPTYQAPPVITSLDYSPDGRLLAVSAYHEIVLHRSDGSGIEARLVGMSERIESAVFSPDGKRLAVTGGSPGRMGELQIWDVSARELHLSQMIGYDTCYGASWSPDGKLVGVGYPDNTVRAFDGESGRQVMFSGAHNDWVLDTVFSTKSDHLISVGRDRSMKLVHVVTQRFIDNITSITPGALKGGLNAVDRHPAKDELLVGGADGTPKIYRMVREKARKIGDDYNLIRAFEPMPGRVFDVAFSRDGGRIAAGSSYNNTGEVRIFNAADGKRIARWEAPKGGIYAVAFSPDGKTVAAAGFAGVVQLIDAASGQLLKSFPPVPIQEETVAGTTP